jgi:hypothetical protein
MQNNVKTNETPDKPQQMPTLEENAVKRIRLLPEVVIGKRIWKRPARLSRSLSIESLPDVQDAIFGKQLAQLLMTFTWIITSKSTKWVQIATLLAKKSLSKYAAKKRVNRC